MAAFLLTGSVPGQFSVERVNLKADGSEGIGICSLPAISADGDQVAFMCTGALVPDDTNGEDDAFVRDRTAATTERVSVRADGSEGDGYTSGDLAISGDGTCVGFAHCYTALLPPYGMECPLGYLRDRAGGHTEVYTIRDSGSIYMASIDGASLSRDGRYLAFSASTSFVIDDTNYVGDVFVRDRVAATTERVSVGSAGAQANTASLYPSIGGDGRYVAFDSDASNLATGDTNGVADVFVHDRVTGATTRVSVSSTGTEANGPSVQASISADGRYVAFQSSASNLVTGDTNGQADVFVVGIGPLAARWPRYEANVGETRRGLPYYTAAAPIWCLLRWLRPPGAITSLTDAIL